MYAQISLFKKFRKFVRLMLKRFSRSPEDVTIEISTKCNYRCGMCFRFPLAVEEKLMPFELFEKVIGELGRSCRGSLGYVTFVGLGDVCCHDRLADILRLTKEKLPSAKLELSINIVSFREPVFSGLFREKLIDKISISIDDTLDPGDFYHGWDEEALLKTHRLMELRARYYPQMQVRIQSIIISRAQVERMLRFAMDSGVDILHFMRLDLHAFKAQASGTARPGRGIERKLMNYALKAARPKKLKIVYNNGFNVFMKIASRFDRVCLLSDDHIFVNAEADVLPCFFLRKHAFGNLGKDTLSDILRSKSSSGFYRKQASICAGCDVYKDKQLH